MNDLTPLIVLKSSHEKSQSTVRRSTSDTRMQREMQDWDSCRTAKFKGAIRLVGPNSSIFLRHTAELE